MKKIVFSLALVASPWVMAQESSPSATAEATEAAAPATTEAAATPTASTDDQSKEATASPSASSETSPTASVEATPTAAATSAEPTATGSTEASPTASTEPSANDEKKPTEQAAANEDPEAVTKTFLEAVKSGNCEVIIANVELNKDEKEEDVLADCKKDIEQLKRSLENVKEFKISKSEVADSKAVVNVKYLDEQGKEIKEADKFPLIKTDKGWKTSF